MCSQWSSKQRIRLNLPISAFYPHFSVLSPFQRFIPISAFYPHFSVLSPFQRFIPISAFYPHFSVLSPFQRFIPISAFYPHFSFRFQFPFPRFSFSVLSLPPFLAYYCKNIDQQITVKPMSQFRCLSNLLCGLYSLMSNISYKYTVTYSICNIHALTYQLSDTVGFCRIILP